MDVKQAFDLARQDLDLTNPFAGCHVQRDPGPAIGGSVHLHARNDEAAALDEADEPDECAFCLVYFDV
tara:strand:- start:35106 stop:35309 length:204 start_codon:yes stop_codon:yes gene_type:complete